jgi:transcriptional regulator
MANRADKNNRLELLQGTLDLIVMRGLAATGPQHAYALAARLAQIADHPLPLKQGTLYASLVRLDQRGWIKGEWRLTESNREAKYYALTRSGRRALEIQNARWARLTGFLDKLLLEEM